MSDDNDQPDGRPPRESRSWEMVFIVQAKPWKPQGIEKVIAATAMKHCKQPLNFFEGDFRSSLSWLMDASTALKSSPRQWWMWKSHREDLRGVSDATRDLHFSSSAATRRRDCVWSNMQTRSPQVQQERYAWFPAGC